MLVLLLTLNNKFFHYIVKKKVADIEKTVMDISKSIINEHAFAVKREILKDFVSDEKKVKPPCKKKKILIFPEDDTPSNTPKDDEIIQSLSQSMFHPIRIFIY